jgi:hypothetical protein
MTEKNNVAVTSLNQVPAIFKKMEVIPGTVNLDIGGGKYDKGTEFLKELGVTNLIYDTFNRSQEHNDTVMDYLINKEDVDTVTISNVLCVVEEYAIRASILRLAKTFLKSNGVCYISVYECDKTGVGKVTKTGSYQSNRKYKDYLDEVRAIFDIVETRKGMIIARRGY